MLEVGVQKKYEKKRKILASEVNEKALKKTDVNVLLKQIADAEHAVDTQVTNRSVKHLMELYQKAIEYYSALDNKCFEDFLNRMTNLFKREEIQKALAQPDEEEKQAPPEEKKSESPMNVVEQSLGPFKPGDLLDTDNPDVPDSDNSKAKPSESDDKQPR
jgi:hypothetical protein